MKTQAEIESSCGYQIHTTAGKAAVTAGGAAIIPLPFVPLAAIPALMILEVDLTMKIAREFGENINRAMAKGLAGSCGCTVVGLTAALGLSSMVAIPGASIVINGGVAATVVEAFGWLIFEHYKDKYF